MTARELADLYDLMEPGETFAGLTVMVVNGCTRSWLVLDRDGARRVVVGEDEQRGQGAA